MTKKRLVILTGAGMPAAWGGLLARDIGSLLWSHVASRGMPTSFFYQKNGQHAYSPAKSPRSYEDVLADVPPKLLGKYLESLRHVFDFHQSLIERPSTNVPSKHMFGELIEQLGFDLVELFTLNQDHTIEHLATFNTPPSRNFHIDTLGHPVPECLSDVIPVIHLHGKMDWTDSKGNPVIITGSGDQKWNQIKLNEEVRIRWERFEGSLRESDSILVLGYSFFDKHVNVLLARYSDRKERPLVIVGANPFGEWINSIHPSLISENRMILDRFFASIRGYYSSGLADCLPDGRLWEHFLQSIQARR